MDRQLGVLHGPQNDRLQQVAGAVGPNDQPAVGVFAGIVDGKDMIAWRMSLPATPCFRAAA